MPCTKSELLPHHLDALLSLPRSLHEAIFEIHVSFLSIGNDVMHPFLMRQDALEDQNLFQDYELTEKENYGRYIQRIW